MKQDGAIPEGDQEGPAGAADEKTARLRFLASGRKSNPRHQRLRHDKAQGEVRRDAGIDARQVVRGSRGRALVVYLYSRTI